MKLGSVQKQPAEKFSYTVTYVDALTIGDNVQSTIVTSTPVGLTITNEAVIDPRVRFWVTGGVDGGIYKITVTTTTADSRVFQDEITFKIKEI